MQLVLNTHGLSFQVKNGLFRVSAAAGVRDISPELIDSIAVTNACMLSSAAIQLAAEAEIPIYIFDRYGEADACLRSPYFESLATLRRKQVYFSDRKEGAAWVVRQFELKTDGQLNNLRYLGSRRKALAREIEKSAQVLQAKKADLRKRYLKRPSKAWSSSIMGWEGHTAKTYWSIVGKAVPSPWTFNSRNRRPALDPYNALTNYFYGMLYAITERALFAAGLDPHLGILHADEYDRPTLAYDLIEPFRPWVDRFLLTQVKSIVSTAMFTAEKDGGYWVTKEAKRELIPAFNTWMMTNVRWEGRQMKRNSHVFYHAAQLAKLIDRAVKRP